MASQVSGRTATPLEVENGMLIITQGYRCRVSNVSRGMLNGSLTARYTLASEPAGVHRNRLPVGFEGMGSGGNHLARVFIVDEAAAKGGAA